MTGLPKKTRKPLLDYNPDREGHVPKKWMVIRATRDRNFKSVVLDDGQEMKFGKKGAFMVSDPGKADEIRKTVGADATVTRFRVPTTHERMHRYFFGQLPAMPWHRYDDLGRKIQEGQENEN